MWKASSLVELGNVDIRRKGREEGVEQVNIEFQE